MLCYVVGTFADLELINFCHPQKTNNGVVMVNFFPDYVTCSKNATLNDVAGWCLLMLLLLLLVVN